MHKFLLTAQQGQSGGILQHKVEIASITHTVRLLGQPFPVAFTSKGEKKNPGYLKSHWTNNQITF